MAFSVLGSMGLCSVFGVKSTLIIVEVIPFLVLAVCDYFRTLAIRLCMCIIILFLWAVFGRTKLLSCVMVERRIRSFSIPGLYFFCS